MKLYCVGNTENILQSSLYERREEVEITEESPSERKQNFQSQ